MKPWIWLRIASVLNVLFVLGHGTGHINTIRHAMPGGEGVVNAMKAFHFNVMGSDRTQAPWLRGGRLRGHA